LSEHGWGCCEHAVIEANNIRVKEFADEQGLNCPRTLEPMWPVFLLSLRQRDPPR
jgi:hypothetical protein